MRIDVYLGEKGHAHSKLTYTESSALRALTYRQYVEAFSPLSHDGMGGCLRSRLMFADRNAGVSFVSRAIFLSPFPRPILSACFCAEMGVPRRRPARPSARHSTQLDHLGPGDAYDTRIVSIPRFC